MQTSTASAAPVFNTYPISATYKKPGAMTVAGGDLWYFESSTATAPVDSMGRMTTSGVTTDYVIGNPTGITNFVASEMTTGSDGNIWFIGASSGGVSLGKLDISTGAVTFYSSAIPAYSGGHITSGADGKIYYSAKSGNTGNTYLRSLDPTTGVTAAVRTYDTYTNISGIAPGPDGRLYITDVYQYYNRIYAVSLSGGTDNYFYLPNAPDKIIAGPDGNVWFLMAGKIEKMTTAGVRTEYTPPTGVSPRQLVAGSDGAVWFDAVTKIGRITTTGVVTTYDTPDSSAANSILGPDGAIWFDYYIPNGVQKVGRIPTTPTFDTYPISATYKKPGAMTIAGGDLWYLESSTATAPIDSIGRMTTSGTTTDYTIGYPTSFTVSELTTGSDGNVWFVGTSSGGLSLGKLDIFTGVVTFYAGSIPAYSGGHITTGSDGKIYYSAKSGASNSTYLRSLDPTTGTTAAVRSYDTFTNISSMTSGPDGRLYITDAYQYYNRIYAVSLTGGTDNYFYLSDTPDKITAGPDGNLWFVMGTKIEKMTTAGVKTDYTLPAGVNARKLVAGSDGAVWFLDHSQKIGRITTAGVVTTYTIPDVNIYDAAGPVLGPDGAIWFDYYTTNGTQKLGRLGY
jgi:virginiamycin B lyase